MEHVIANADSFGLDAHRVVFFASSAGASLCNYLSFVYHQWNMDRFSPVGMVLSNPQFNLPFFGVLDYVWQDIVDHMKPGTLLQEVLPFSMCHAGLECAAETKAPCNATFNQVTHQRYCASEAAFNVATLEQVKQTQTWDRSKPEYGLGLEKLWLTSKNMLAHQPRPFHILVANVATGADANIFHLPMYAQQYAEYAAQVGINYTVYFGDYPAMRAPPLFPNAKESAKVQEWNYASSTGWRDEFAYSLNSKPSPMEQHELFSCYVAGIPSCAPKTAVMDKYDLQSDQVPGSPGPAAVSPFSVATPLMAMFMCLYTVGVLLYRTQRSGECSSYRCLPVTRVEETSMLDVSSETTLVKVPATSITIHPASLDATRSPATIQCRSV
jgi:hypothetical protein